MTVSKRTSPTIQVLIATTIVATPLWLLVACVDTGPQSPQELLHRANEHRRASRLREAKELYVSVLDLSGRTYVPTILLANAAYHAGLIDVYGTDVETGVSRLETAIELGSVQDPSTRRQMLDEFFAYQTLYVGYLAMGDTARARESAERSLVAAQSADGQGGERELQALVMLASVEIDEGRILRAQGVLDQIRSIIENGNGIANVQLNWEYRLLQARLLVVQRNLVSADASLRELIRDIPPVRGKLDAIWNIPSRDRRRIALPELLARRSLVLSAAHEVLAECLLDQSRDEEAREQMDLAAGVWEDGFVAPITGGQTALDPRNRDTSQRSLRGSGLYRLRYERFKERQAKFGRTQAPSMPIAAVAAAAILAIAISGSFLSFSAWYLGPDTDARIRKHLDAFGTEIAHEGLFARAMAAVGAVSEQIESLYRSSPAIFIGSGVILALVLNVLGVVVGGLWAQSHGDVFYRVIELKDVPGSSALGQTPVMITTMGASASALAYRGAYVAIPLSLLDVVSAVATFALVRHAVARPIFGRVLLHVAADFAIVATSVIVAVAILAIAFGLCPVCTLRTILAEFQEWMRSLTASLATPSAAHAGKGFMVLATAVSASLPSAVYLIVAAMAVALRFVPHRIEKVLARIAARLAEDDVPVLGRLAIALAALATVIGAAAALVAAWP